MEEGVLEEFGGDNDGGDSDDGGEMVRRWLPQRVVEVVAAKSVKTGEKRAKNRRENKSKNVTTAEVAETVKIDAINVNFIDVIQDLRTLGALVPVSTAYKRKQDKVRPGHQPTNGEGTGGDPNFLEKCEEREKQEGRHTPRWQVSTCGLPLSFLISHTDHASQKSE